MDAKETKPFSRDVIGMQSSGMTRGSDGTTFQGWGITRGPNFCLRDGKYSDVRWAGCEYNYGEDLITDGVLGLGINTAHFGVYGRSQ